MTERPLSGALTTLASAALLWGCASAPLASAALLWGCASAPVAEPGPWWPSSPDPTSLADAGASARWDVGSGEALDGASPAPGEGPAEARAAGEGGTVSLHVPTRAQEAEDSAADDDEWEFIFTPYLWALSIDGSATFKGTTTQIDQDFSDIFGDLNFVVEGRFEAWKEDWGWFLDLTYAQLQADGRTAGFKTDTTTDMVIALGGAQHMFVDQEPEHGVGGLRLSGVAGVTYTRIDADLDVKGAPSFDGRESWYDPIAGLKAHWNFTPEWTGFIETYLGGFELLGGSEQVTLMSMMVGRRLGDASELFFGWRSYDIDYDSGKNLEVDVGLSGPIAGWALRF